MPETARLIGQQIRNIRTVNGLTMEELAERAGLSNGFISEIERGKKLPSLDTLAKIAAALQVRLGDLTAPMETDRAEVVNRFELLARLQRVMKEFYTPQEADAIVALARKAEEPGGC